MRELEARVQEVGLAETVSVDLAATIVPTHGDTVAVRSEAPVRRLPLLSFDLRLAPEGAKASPESDLEVRDVIGEGGMGRVLLARQHSLERDVAVKTARPGAGAHAVASIVAEGAITGRLEHPAIVPVHALGLDAAGQPAMIMKRIEGVAWNELLRDPSHPGWAGWEGTPGDRLPGHLQILLAICNALHFAHSRGVVHRDVKPENVLIGRFGDVYVADWGVAGHAGEAGGALCGTPGYMAPEMALGRRIDARTDVYLLGSTLHEILTGRLRHPAENLLAALGSAMLSEPFEYGDAVPRELGELANLACSADPDRRPQTAQAFRDAIARTLRHRDSAALANEARERVARVVRLAATEPADEAEARELDRLAVEARFGLEQALARWPENAEARDALETLEEVLEARRARIAQLEQEARERDPRIEALPRTIGLATLALVGVLISGFVLWQTGAPSPLEFVAYPSVVGAVIAVGTVTLRRRVLRTRFNRQVLAALGTIIGLLWIGRVLGLVVEIEPAEHLVRDSFVMAACCAVLGATLLRWTLWLSTLYLGCGIACALLPGTSVGIFSVCTAAAVVLACLFSWRARR